MRILILHRVPFQFIRYDDLIDHALHDVVYVGMREALAGIPETLRCTRIERPGEGLVSDEVVNAVRGQSFDRVLSMSQYELMDAARVRDVLGVPGARPADVVRADDKIAMKRAVHAKGLRAPRFMPCRDVVAGSAPWAGRTVLKPIDGTASKNVHIFETFEQAKAAIDARAVPELDVDRFEVEEYLAGPIYHSDGFMLGGQPVALIASRYVGTCLGFAHGEPLGSVQLPEDTAVREATLAFLDAVGIVNGPFHLELIQTEGGELAFLEVASRPGGGDIVDVFMRKNGVDLVAAQLLVELDASPLAENSSRDKLSPKTPTEDRTYGFVMYPGHKVGATHGRLVGAEPFREHPNVVKWKELEPGKALPDHVTYFDFELPLDAIVSGRTPFEVEHLVRRILSAVTVVPESPSPS